MRYYCHFCFKSVTSEMPNESVIRAILVCPECMETGKVIFPEDEEKTMHKYENGQNAERIQNTFKYYPPTSEQAERYQLIRDGAKQLALLINGATPASREQSLAFTALEEVVYHANASIARNE